MFRMRDASSGLVAAVLNDDVYVVKFISVLGINNGNRDT
jgi:hypothetical protein